MKRAIKNIIMSMPAALGVAAMPAAAEAEKISWKEPDLSQPAPVAAAPGQVVAWPQPVPPAADVRPVDLPPELIILRSVSGFRQ